MLATNMSSSTFDPAVFLAHAGLGRRVVELKEGENFFTQGDQATAVFYIQHGRAKLTVVSQSGKEATLSLLCSGDFVGESALAAIPRAASDNGYRPLKMHGAQDHNGRNDPGHASRT
jgi:CRP/FNR family transcriptional regulator, cyclic AMP receptor protein